MTLADARFSKSFILRPYVDFEDDYQGNSAAYPVMFTEEQEALDNQAGEPGYDPDLVKGLSVPMGARCLIWLPDTKSIFSISDQRPYQWNIIWRLRNVFDYRKDRKRYHYPKQSAGFPYQGDGSARVVLPCAVQSIVYNDPAPVPASGTAFNTMYYDVVQVRADGRSVRPFVPGGGNGVVQQGVTPINGAKTNAFPTYALHEVQAAGDELLIAARRDVTDEPNWDFTDGTGVDRGFSTAFGKGSGQQLPDLGVYVHVGSAP
jgi:hypothetical protein